MYTSIGIGIVCCAAAAARIMFVICRRNPARHCALETHTALQTLIRQTNDINEVQRLVSTLIPWLDAAERMELRKDWIRLAARAITAQKVFERINRLHLPQSRASLRTYREIQRACETGLEVGQEVATRKEAFLEYCRQLTSSLEEAQIRRQFGRLSHLQNIHSQLERQGYKVPETRIKSLQDDLAAAETIVAEKLGGMAFELLVRTERDLRETEKYYEDVPRLVQRYGSCYDQGVGALHCAKDRYTALVARFGKCRYEMPDLPWTELEVSLKEIATSFDEVHGLLDAARKHISPRALRWKAGRAALQEATQQLDDISVALDETEQYLAEFTASEADHLLQTESAR